MQLELKQIQIGGGTQPRVRINEETVSEYAEELRAGATFPPVVVFHDGVAYWLADGFHRYHAHRRVKREQIEAEVQEGTLRDAILHSVGANGQHGLRRTNEDKRKAVETMLTNDVVAKDEHGNPWSDREIARRCAVSPDTANRIRRRLSLSESDSEKSAGTAKRAYTSKHGTPTVMKTDKIGRGNQRRSGPTGGISKQALQPRQVHGEDGPVPMRAISLPLNNPQQAARSMLGLYGETYIRDLVAELTTALEERKGNHQ